MNKLSKIFTYSLIILFICFSIFPLLWMVSTSIKLPGDIYSIPPKFFTTFTLQHYKYVLWETQLVRYFFNSILVSGVATLISLTLAVFGGYGFARFRFKGKNAMSIVILFSQMLPRSILLVPLYILLAALKLLDTYQGLIFTYLVFTIPLTTWILRGFFAAIPSELEEVAMLDGCTRFQALVKVIIPVSIPAIIATGLYCFIVAWEEFIFALSFTNSYRVKTLPIGISDFVGQFGVDWGAIMASSVIVSLPIIILFMLFYRQFISTFTEGMMKG